MPELRTSFHGHHENFDGTGYPDGLKGAEIPLILRVVRSCGFFDAVCFDRPCAWGRSGEDTILLMTERKDCFEPEPFEAFTSNLGSIDRITGLAA